ncbi:MAG: YeiH family protein [Saccharofermentans sp.]|jgi:uncharacterized integral membrane protein (TIGR00698 family)|nr:YeiH family protein [Mageeibacillus sp.]MCI1263580.1 YeiH family protein [Saccharofermentans sp.]MCI1274482.1 YeiH family protein [Saccharofermentans sp.]
MKFIKTNWIGIAVCLLVAVPSWFLGKLLPTVGGPVFSIVIGMLIALVWKEKGRADSGIKFTSKYILQSAVVLLGFGLNLNVIAKTGVQSLPIILCTITTSLLLAFVMQKVLRTSGNTATLVGVGSSICGGSAIAATAPVIKANDDEVAQAISVIFFYNVIAAILFPIFGHAIGMSTTTGEAFGIFAGTAVNDTSSVTAAASTWDSMWKLGTQTLDKAVTVKLTRTLAIIPITLVLALLTARKEKLAGTASENTFSFKRAFPMFILWFILMSVITTVAVRFGVPIAFFNPLKELSKFFIIIAMGAIGLNSNIIKLIKTGEKPLLIGAICWVGITSVSLVMQRVMGLW